LPLATRLLMIKSDGSVLVHSDGGSYKPLNWMSPPCSITIADPDDDQADAGITALWTVTHAKTADQLVVSIYEVQHDSAHELGIDPGLIKDGAESHLQKLLAEHIHLLGEGFTFVRREYMTAIGPVDLLAQDAAGRSELMNRDPHLAPVSGVFAAQTIKPQARRLAEDRGIRCLLLDYDAMRGLDDTASKLF
jgi:hypothetical protein